MPEAMAVGKTGREHGCHRESQIRTTAVVETRDALLEGMLHTHSRDRMRKRRRDVRVPPLLGHCLRDLLSRHACEGDLARDGMAEGGCQSPHVRGACDGEL